MKLILMLILKTFQREYVELAHLGVHKPVMHQVDSVYSDFQRNKKLLFNPADSKEKEKS